jgi:hypothetical protein
MRGPLEPHQFPCVAIRPAVIRAPAKRIVKHAAWRENVAAQEGISMKIFSAIILALLVTACSSPSPHTSTFTGATGVFSPNDPYHGG